MTCTKCGDDTEFVTDIDGETLPECRMCGVRQYKTPTQLGIDIESDADPAHKHVNRLSNPDSNSNIMPDSGCRWATDFLGHQSLCLECPFPECKLIERALPTKEEAAEREGRRFPARIRVETLSDD